MDESITMMSINEINNDEFEVDKDPLEISEEIQIKNEIIDSAIKQELEDIDIYHDQDPGVPSTSQPVLCGVPKIVNVEDLLNKIDTDNNRIKKVGDANKETNKSNNINKIDQKKNNVISLSVPSAEGSKQVADVLKRVVENKLNINPVKISQLPIKEKPVMLELSTNSTNKGPTLADKIFGNLTGASSNQVVANNIVSVAIPLPQTKMLKTPLTTNAVFNVAETSKKNCNCMRHITLYCTYCDASSFYRKDLVQCNTCKTLLKLQCSQCHKRFSYLSSVHQYVLQMTQRQNLFIENKELKFQCVKRISYICSKCNKSFISKEKLNEHFIAAHPTPVISEPKFNFDDKFIKLTCRACKVDEKLLPNSPESPTCKGCTKRMEFKCAFCERCYLTLRNARKHMPVCKIRLKKPELAASVRSCAHCSFMTTDELALIAHLAIYHTPQFCKYCDFQTTEEPVLAAHIATYHKPLFCNHCSFNTTEKTELAAHNEEFHKPRICKNCNFQTTEKSIMDAHNDANHKLLFCKHCNFQTTLVSAMDTHTAVYHKPIQCEQCSFQTVKDYSEMVEHMADHHTPKNCPDCKSVFMNSIVLEQHLRGNKCSKKTGEFRCEYCNFETKQKAVMDTHVAAYHQMRDCEYCNFQTIRKSVMDAHVAAYHKSLLCEYCSFQTTEISVLESHIAAYHKSHTCSACGSVFMNANVLSQHLLNSKECKKKAGLSSTTLPEQTLIQIAEGQRVGKKDAPPNKAAAADKNLVVVIPSAKKIAKTTMMNELATNNVAANPTTNSNNAETTDYEIVGKDPATMLQDMTGSSAKNSGTVDWDKLVDYFCSGCMKHSTNKFSEARPNCRKCVRWYDFRCVLCGLTFYDSKAIYKHVKVDCSMQEKIVCQLCNYSTSRKHILFTHIKVNHTLFKCKKCDTDHEGFKNLQKHQTECQAALMDQEAELKKHISPFCRKCKKNIPGFIKNYADETICPKCVKLGCYCCLKCKSIFDDYKTAYEHVKDQCKPQFCCRMCDFKAFRTADLETHINFKHTIWKCSYCNQSFKDEHVFKLHRREELKLFKPKGSRQRKRKAAEES